RSPYSRQSEIPPRTVQILVVVFHACNPDEVPEIVADDLTQVGVDVLLAAVEALDAPPEQVEFGNLVAVRTQLPQAGQRLAKDATVCRSILFLAPILIGRERIAGQVGQGLGASLGRMSPGGSTATTPQLGLTAGEGQALLLVMVALGGQGGDEPLPVGMA